MLSPLALELCYLIIEHVGDKNDLCALALCCSTFQDKAQRCLFGHVDLALAIVDRQKQFLSAINREPLRLGPLVHSFCSSEWWPKDEEPSVSLSDALRAMNRLRHLKLYCQVPSTFLHGYTFQLQTIACGYVLDAEEVSFLFFDFLPNQKRVKRLQLHIQNTVDLSGAPRSLCPQLESMSLNDERLIDIFFPNNRPVYHLQWFKFDTPPPLSITQLNYLKSLTLCINFEDMDISFTSYLTSLVNLELRIRVVDPDERLDRIHFIRNIPHLHVLWLVVNDRWLQIAEEEFHLRFSASFQQLFDLGPRLKHIDVTYGYTSKRTTTLMENGISIWTQQSFPSTNVREWRYLA